ncbi:MAG: YeeE/YedE thiosulfate transporter family protein [Pseudomonadales bacterium]|nr:YeeE/YedE thiosulfate transporter family protein [Pseudomonadales bacterium]
MAIGYLAQITGLCMVRGITDWMQGRHLRLIAIVSSGFWIYLYLPLMQFAQLRSHLTSYDFHWGFPAGGVIFGLGAAINGSCSISTASRLASGDLRMLFTMMGWLLGWLASEYTGLDFVYRELDPASLWLCWVIIVCLALASTLIYWRQRQNWRLWSGIMLVGILVGALFLLQPAWSPSDFIRDLGLAIIKHDPEILPALDRVALLLLMLIGMGIGAWRYRRFHWHVPGLQSSLKHLGSGTLMGLGAAFALGGNDYQLLLALPALSPAGFSALLGMLGGIWMGIRLIGSPSQHGNQHP